jgi:biotin operon repressor
MFGDKRAKQERLQQLKGILARREAGATELGRELGVSRFTVLDDIATLERRGEKVCEHRGKFSLLEKWFKK